jgi:hypothetical protein
MQKNSSNDIRAIQNSKTTFELRRGLQQAYLLAESASSTSCFRYLNHVIIDSRPDPTLFREIAEPWQWALVNKILPAIEHVANIRPDYAAHRNFWLTLPKGHDKSSLIARLINWALAFNTRSFTGYVAAADKEQAGLLAKAMQDESRLNPWLAKRLDFRNWKIHGINGSSIEILAADAASSHGIRGDLLIVDELTHWHKPDLWNALLSGREKRPGSVLIVITNAGLKYTWQHDTLETFKSSPRWFVYEAPGKLASWMDSAAMDDLRRTVPPQLARRLFDNEWVDPSDGCNFLTRKEVDECVSNDYTPHVIGQSGVSYIASIDYGPVRDRTVCTLIHRNEDDTLHVDRMDVMQGSRENPVKIEAVERWIDDIRSKYELTSLVIDPYQMESTFQKFTGTLPVHKFEARGGKSNYEMAQTVRSLVVNKKLFWYPDCGTIFIQGGGKHTLVDEFCELITKVMSYGFRIDHLPNRHDDRAISLGMACLEALRVRPKKKLFLEGEYF